VNTVVDVVTPGAGERGGVGVGPVGEAAAGNSGTITGGGVVAVGAVVAGAVVDDWAGGGARPGTVAVIGRMVTPGLVGLCCRRCRDTR
jgi:hypothetical protein